MNLFWKKNKRFYKKDLFEKDIHDYYSSIDSLVEQLISTGFPVNEPTNFDFGFVTDRLAKVENLVRSLNSMNFKNVEYKEYSGLFDITGDATVILSSDSLRGLLARLCVTGFEYDSKLVGFGATVK